MELIISVNLMFQKYCNVQQFKIQMIIYSYGLLLKNMNQIPDIVCFILSQILFMKYLTPCTK